MAGTRVLHVYLDGVFVGHVEQTSGGSLSFTYDYDYRDGEDPTPLSLSMPLGTARHKNKKVRAYLEGLLPDSRGARARWGRQYGVSPNNPFSLLRHVGRDAAGAVQILGPDEDASDALARDGDIEWLTDDDFAHMARDLAEHGSDWDPGRFGGRWSLAGAQPKLALFRDPETLRWGIPKDSTPTTHIIKPVIEGYARHHINEALCLRAAKEVGLLTARVDLVEVEDIQAVISHRYDRDEVDGAWVRVHQEDFCQALSVHPSLKYQMDGGPGVGEISDLLATLSIDDREVSTERFFKGLALNVLIGGTDAHAKNYSLILIGNRAQVAPLYDVASAACYPQYERLVAPMRIGEHDKLLDVTAKDWERIGRRLGMAGDLAVQWVEDLRNDLPGAFERATEGLPEHTRAEAGGMANRIVEHVTRTWRPDLSRNPRYVASETSTSRRDRDT